MRKYSSLIHPCDLTGPNTYAHIPTTGLSHTATLSSYTMDLSTLSDRATPWTEKETHVLRDVIVMYWDSKPPGFKPTKAAFYGDIHPLYNAEMRRLGGMTRDLQGIITFWHDERVLKQAKPTDIAENKMRWIPSDDRIAPVLPIDALLEVRPTAWKTYWPQSATVKFPYTAKWEERHDLPLVKHVVDLMQEDPLMTYGDAADLIFDFLEYKRSMQAVIDKVCLVHTKEYGRRYELHPNLRSDLMQEYWKTLPEEEKEERIKKHREARREWWSNLPEEEKED